MKRLIEELIEKRKRVQEKFLSTLQEIGTLFEKPGFFKKKRSGIQQKCEELGRDLSEWMTIQDKEWDAYSNNHASIVFKSLQWKIDKLEAEYSQVKKLLQNFITLEKSLQEIIDSLDRSVNTDTIERLRNIKDQLSVYQYSDFEQRFRGDEEKVKEKLKKYIPFFLDTDGILDLGCGRGEFLELLRKEDKKVEGIDISESMLNSARQKGLNCYKSDILDFLKKKPDNSIGGVFSSQVIEHLQPDYLRQVVAECYRVLKENTPIIFETINPLSLFALSRIFFLDTTHQKPFHPEYMRYLLESSGFSQVEIHYSEELIEEKLEDIPPENQLARVFNANVDKLNQILFASPHYAVKGIK